MTVSRYGGRTAAVWASLRGLATGAAVTVMPTVATIAMMAASLAVRLHVLTIIRVSGYACPDIAQRWERHGLRPGMGHRQSRPPPACPPCGRPRPSSHNEVTGNQPGKLRQATPLGTGARCWPASASHALPQGRYRIWVI